MPGKKSRSALGKLSRNKGKVFERFVAAAFREVYGDTVKRGWQAREGHDAPDVENTPFWVECKHHKKVNIHAAVAQAREESERAKSGLPILVATQNNGERPLVVVEMETFFTLLAAYEASKKTLAGARVTATPQLVNTFKPAQPQGRSS